MRWDMFYDYYRGISQREMEQKYDLNIRTIARYCKNIMSFMFNTPEHYINEGLHQIQAEYNQIQKGLKDNKI